MVAITRQSGVQPPARVLRDFARVRDDGARRIDRYVSDNDRAFVQELARRGETSVLHWKGLVVQMQPQIRPSDRDADQERIRERHNIRQLNTIQHLKYVTSLPVDETTIVAVWLNPNDGKIVQVTEQAFVEIEDEIAVVLEVERQPAGFAITDIYLGALAMEAPQFVKEWELRLGMVIPMTAEVPGSVTMLTPLATSMMASTALVMGSVVRT